MRILSLNTWGGQRYHKLLEFVASHARPSHPHAVDVFCFQEVFDTTGGPAESNGARMNLMSELERVLLSYRSFYAPSEGGADYQGNVSFPVSYGLAMFVVEGYKMGRMGSHFVHHGQTSGDKFCKKPRNVQYVELCAGKDAMTVYNFHGVWNGNGKGDSEDRLLQAGNIRAVLDKTPKRSVLIGDFNLTPETESMRMLEGANMRNLIKEYKVESTRTALYQKPTKHADYALVSRDMKVAAFTTIDNDVSDHQALYVEVY